MAEPAPAGGVPPEPGAWLSLGEASRVLGITPATLRRWADRGQVASFTTPGGHRRFLKAAITALLPASRTRRPHLAEPGAVGPQVSLAYRAALRAGGPVGAGWLAGLPEPTRTLFRERGRRMAECLIAHLDAEGPAPAMANLHEAAGHAAEYGSDMAALGFDLSTALEAFLRFRSPFMDYLAATARKRGLDTREAIELLRDAEAATDRLLVAFATGWRPA